MSARRCRPAGQLLFLEHVRDEDPRIAKKQDNPAVPLLLDGVPSEPSHPGRDYGSKLSVVAVRRGAVPKASVIERPMVLGRATRSAG